MSIKEMEAALEATRKKISLQLSLVGKSIQSIDPTLYDKERELEQVIAMWRVEEFDHEPSHSAREHWNINKAAEIEDGDIEPMSSNKWRGILQELAQRCPPDRWADDHQEGPSPDTFECGYCCALMQLHALSMREGHCIPIDEFPMPMRAISKQQEQDQNEAGKGQIEALKHWEKCFREGYCSDEHGEYIADVLASERMRLESWIESYERMRLESWLAEQKKLVEEENEHG